MAAVFSAMTALAPRFLLFCALWLLLSEARSDFLLPGLAAAALATAASVRIGRPGGGRLRPGALLAYLPHFLWRSLVGGLDVAGRVCHPRLPIDAAFLNHRCRLQGETARAVFCDVVTLMPGTLAASLEGREALLHLLSDDAALRRQLAVEEDWVLRLFGETAGGRHG